MRIQLQSKREIKSNMSNMNVEWQLCFLHETLVSLCLHVFRCFPLFSRLNGASKKKAALICWCYCFQPCQPTALVHSSSALHSINLNDFRSHKFMANSIKTDMIFIVLQFLLRLPLISSTSISISISLFISMEWFGFAWTATDSVSGVIEKMLCIDVDDDDLKYANPQKTQIEYSCWFRFFILLNIEKCNWILWEALVKGFILWTMV